MYKILIEPKWNLKIAVHNPFTSVIVILIEPKWNLKWNADEKQENYNNHIN